MGNHFTLTTFSVGSQPTFDFLIPVGVRPVEEQQHLTKLSLQRLEVRQKVSTIYRLVLSEELLALHRDGSEDTGPPMRTGRKDEGPAASESPDVTDNRIVEEDGFVLA
jgi:hypothetical protein